VGGTKGVMGRGVRHPHHPDLNQPWGDSLSCTSCGKCVKVCPTGALVKKANRPAKWKSGAISALPAPDA
jgi:NADH dehydrogenase/NADH:ubiquinone oxidoreductase subunit G